MTSYFLRIRLNFLVLCYLLLVSSGCAGGISLLEYQPDSGGPPAQVENSIHASAVSQVPEGLPVTVASSIVAPVEKSLAPPRHPRASRYNTPPDSSYRNRILTEDTTWRGQVLIEGSLTVAPSVTLVITPGTVVRFRPTADGDAGLLLIRGRIQATGVSDLPIIFMSDEINPALDDWQGIMFLDSSKKNLLEWCRVEAATSGVAVEFSDVTLRQTFFTHCRTGMAFHASTAVINGGVATECMTGLVIRDGDVELSGGTLSDNDRGIVMNGGSFFLVETEVSGSKVNALEVTGGRLRLAKNRIVRNNGGTIFSGCRGDLVGNRMEENWSFGLELVNSPLKVSGNRIIGNSLGGVMVRVGGATLWDNILERNGDRELVVSGSVDVAAPANWWGSADPVRIRGRIRETDSGRVFFTPYLESPPQ